MNPLPRARALAHELLLRQKPARLPIKVERLCFEKNVVIDSLGHYLALTNDTREGLCVGAQGALDDGCTLIKRWKGKETYIILYNERVCSGRRRNFTLAHELGHIYLGHTGDDAAQERQANAFAAQLLLPRILADEYLRTLRDTTDPARALADAFDISVSMSRLHLRYPLREPYTDSEKALLVRYRAALPHPNEPEILY